MKSRILLLVIALIVLWCFSFTRVTAQPLAWQDHFCYNGGNIRANAVVLDSLYVNIPSAGKVVVHFDGSLTTTPQNFIVLAASNIPHWLINDGNVSFEVASDTANTRSFSLTRSYDVTAGVDSFYAVVQNFLDTLGTDTINICGSLTVEFFPAAGAILLSDTSTNFIDENVRGAPVSVVQTSLSAPDAGQLLVHFDGACVSDVGDVITLAASDSVGWVVNDNDDVEAVDNNYDNNSPFAHTQLYAVGAGTDTFYGVAQNWVETTGDGLASVYGNLSVEFFPDTGAVTVTIGNIDTSNISVRPGPVVFNTITIYNADSGEVLVTLDGNCSSSVGDRIILAASNVPVIALHDSSISVKAIDNIYNSASSFSHSRLYTVGPGPNTFYALAQNYGDTAGSGNIYLYAQLTVKYYKLMATAINTTGINDPKTGITGLEVYPNPANNQVTVLLQGDNGQNPVIELMDLTGRTLQRIEFGDAVSTLINLSSLTDGMYFIRANGMVKQIVKE